MIDFEKTAKNLGLKFNNISLFKEALTHRSFLNENREWKIPHNERLEFLGDSVLGFIVADYLIEKYPYLEEGELTSLRAALVNSYSLMEIAKKIDLEKYLLVSRGEAKESKNSRSYLLANAVEALIAALYLDGGIENARQFVEKYLFQKAEEILASDSYKDPKSLFQEKSQELLEITPVYKTFRAWGPDHAKEFEVGVYLGEELIAVSSGYSKQEAEIEAAKKALEIKGWI